jgi:hypothetical protein
LRDYAHQVFGSLDGSQMAWSCWMKASFAAKRKPWFESPTHMQQPYLWSLQLWSELMTFFTYPLEFQSEIQGRRLNMKKPERLQSSIHTPL